MNSNNKKEMITPVVNPDTTCVGLDISKARLDSFVPGGKPREDANTAEGHAAFIRYLLQLQHPRVICEATGGYEKAIVAALIQAGIEVCVVSPGRVRHFALAEGLLAKNDHIDARLLARFGESIRLRCEVPANPHAVRLREMLEYRRVLSDQIVAANCRLELACGYLREGIELQLNAFKASLKKVDADISAHIASHPDLDGKARRLRELCGVGPVLAATLLAYMPELGQLNGKIIASLIGVAPHPKDSGPHRGKRRVAAGRACVRRVLYMAAISSARSNPIIAAFYRRLREEKGKPHKVAIVAVMRKMINVLNRLIADPNFSLA